MHISDGNAAAYIAVIVPLIVFGVVANASFLAWQALDNRLVCSFTICLGNLALCSLMVALLLPPLQIVLLFYQDATLCIIQRIATSFLELEESLLILIITLDRVYFLIADLPHYRHFANVRRMFYGTVVSWVLVILAIGCEWSLNWDTMHTDSPDDCLVLRPPGGALLSILSDSLTLCLTLLTIRRCLKPPGPTEEPSSFYLSQAVSASLKNPVSTHLQLHGREGAANAQVNMVYDMPDNSTPKLGKTTSPSSFPRDASPFKEAADKSHEAGAENEESDVDVNRKGKNQCEIQQLKIDAGGGRNSTMSLRSQTSGQRLDSDHASSVREKGVCRQHDDFSTSRSLCKALGETSTASDAWYAHPRIKSSLPPFLSRTLPRGYKARSVAAHQLIVLLFVHLVFGLPAAICKLLATYEAEWRPTVSSFVQWLDLLSTLQACLFPLVYLLYSDRLRGHVLTLQNKFCCRRHRRVHTSFG